MFYIPTLSRGESAAAQSHRCGAKRHKLKPLIGSVTSRSVNLSVLQKKKKNVFVVFPEALFFQIHVAANVLRLRSHFPRLKAVNTAHLISALECIWAEITAKWLHNKNSCWWLSGINQRQSTLCCRCGTGKVPVQLEVRRRLQNVLIFREIRTADVILAKHKGGKLLATVQCCYSLDRESLTS